MSKKRKYKKHKKLAWDAVLISLQNYRPDIWRKFEPKAKQVSIMGSSTVNIDNWPIQPPPPKPHIIVNKATLIDLGGVEIPIHPAEARKMLQAKQAKILLLDPFTIQQLQPVKANTRSNSMSQLSPDSKALEYVGLPVAKASDTAIYTGIQKRYKWCKSFNIQIEDTDGTQNPTYICRGEFERGQYTATLDSILTLGYFKDGSEFKDGVWQAEKSEMWNCKNKAEVILTVPRLATNPTDEKFTDLAETAEITEWQVEWNVQWYHSPIDAVHQLMSSDPTEWLDLERDNL